jgi:predicted thioesterase
MTSVGTSVALEHRRASPVGTEIEVEAELTELAGRRLVFSFIARHVRPPDAAGPAGELDGDEELDGDVELVAGAGSVERIVVDRARFLARTAAPAG